MRAQESAREDRWFEDPYARRFVEAVWEGDPLPDADAFRDPMWQGIIRSSIVRTRFLDELLAKIDTPQVVILGAGHDATVATTWVAEGLLLYFDDAGVDLLMRRTTDRSPAGSRMALTLRAATGEPPERMAELWRSLAPEDPAGWLAGYGWQGTVSSWTTLARAWGRLHWDTGARAGLVDAVRTLDA